MNNDNPTVWIENDEWVMKVQKAIIEGLKITLILQIIGKNLNI